jgi:hypothetical protein
MCIFVPEVTEASSKESIGVNGISSQPVIALINANRGVVVYMLENGLNSLVMNPSPIISNLKEVLKECNTALILSPVTLAADNIPALKQIRELPVVKVEIPEDTNVSTVATYTLHKMPIVMFFEAEDFASRKFQPVVSYGDIDVVPSVTSRSV